MEWSYGLLEPGDREGLDRLAVFNGWTLEAAEALVGRNADALLERLIDSSLIELDTRGAVTRYRMLETVRQYGMGRLDDAARTAHATYYLDLAERSDAALRTSEQARWIDQLRPEHDNIRTALGWALDTERADLALQLVAATGRFWFMQTRWAEALAWLSRATLVAAGEHELLWARAFIKTGVIEAITQEIPDTSAADRAHAILAEHGTPSELGMATYALAEGQSDADENRRLMEESARLLDAAGDEWGSAYVNR